MKKLIIDRNGFPCKLKDCPSGFFIYKGDLCFKSNSGEDNVYCESGEVFWGCAVNKARRENLKVQPVVSFWEEYNK